jgi:ferrous iron transport protein A
MTDLSTLAELKPGEPARVTGLEGDTTTTRRVMALGFVPGTRVEVVRRSPLGDPTEYQLRGVRVALRSAEARLVRIARETPGAA